MNAGYQDYRPIISKDDLGTCYEILNVNKNSTSKEIDTAYKSLISQWNLKKNRCPLAKERCQHIEDAYRIISDPIKRSIYDKQLKQEKKDKSNELIIIDDCSDMDDSDNYNNTNVNLLIESMFHPLIPPMIFEQFH